MVIPMKFDENPPINLEGGGYTCKHILKFKTKIERS